VEGDARERHPQPAIRQDFAEAVLGFLRETVPRRFDEFSSTITDNFDNFRVIDPKDFRILA